MNISPNLESHNLSIQENNILENHEISTKELT